MKDPPSAMPALAMQIATGPRASATAAMPSRTEDSSVTSIDLRMQPRRGAATSSSTSARRPVIVTSAPASARAARWPPDPAAARR